MEWHISPMTADDISQVVSLEQISFANPWKHAAFLSELSSPFSICYVARAVNTLENAKIVAYLICQCVADELSLLKIAVAPGWKRKGVGSALLKTSTEAALADGARTVFLEVRPSNQAALSFYREHGFQLIGNRPKYYPETGEDALVMAKQLKENE